MKTFSPLLHHHRSLFSQTQPCNLHCQNTHTHNKYPPDPHPHIATNISHELSATSSSWIFIKQKSKQIDFTPAALLHFYLIFSPSHVLSSSSSLSLSVSPSPPLFYSFILSPFFSSSLCLSLVSSSFFSFYYSFFLPVWVMGWNLWPCETLWRFDCVCVCVCQRLYHVCVFVFFCQ